MINMPHARRVVHCKLGIWQYTNTPSAAYRELPHKSISDKATGCTKKKRVCVAWVYFRQIRRQSEKKNGYAGLVFVYYK